MPIGGSSGGLSSAGPGAGGGAQGPQGATGSQGAQGHQGFQGNQGTQGSGGAQGTQGTQGNTGAQGPQGATGGGGDMPIANPTGITTGTETPDPISGTGSLAWVTFPVDQGVMAWGVEGDSFPRVVLGADPLLGFFAALADGTVDPITGGAHIGVDVNAGGINQINLTGNSGGQLTGGATLGALALTGMVITPVGNRAGDGGDAVFAGPGVLGGTDYADHWVISATGAPATWKCVFATGPTDPISAGATPPNTGCLWLDDAGGSGAWISTGAALGDWVQTLTAVGPVLPSSNPHVVGAFYTGAAGAVFQSAG